MLNCIFINWRFQRLYNRTNIDKIVGSTRVGMTSPCGQSLVIKMTLFWANSQLIGYRKFVLSSWKSCFRPLFLYFFILDGVLLHKARCTCLFVLIQISVFQYMVGIYSIQSADAYVHILLANNFISFRCLLIFQEMQLF